MTRQPWTPWAVEPFDPLTASEVARLAVGRLKSASYAVACPEDPPLPPEREALGLVHLTPGNDRLHFVVWEGPDQTRALGWGDLQFSRHENLHTAKLGVVVDSGLRHRGIGGALVRALLAAAREQVRRLVTFTTSSRSPAGEAFARSLGAEAARPHIQSSLDLTGVSDTLLDAWTARPADDPYVLHRWERIPEPYLDRMADLMAVMNTAPRGALEFDDWSITPEIVRAWEVMAAEAGDLHAVMVLEDPRTEALAGFTEVFWNPDRASLVYQGDTVVRPEARGQGLGKWLKAAMIGHVRADFPGARWLRTDNADENAAMLKINRALGFTPWTTLTDWQLRLG